MTGKYGGVTGWFCLFFSQNALQGFMEQTVGSAACVRTEPPATRATENVHVPVDGWAQPVNWVRLRDTVSKSLRMCDRKTTFRWNIFRKILIYYYLFLYIWPSFIITYSDLGTLMLLRQRLMGQETGDDQTGCKQANSFIIFSKIFIWMQNQKWAHLKCPKYFLIALENCATAASPVGQSWTNRCPSTTAPVFTFR